MEVMDESQAGTIAVLAEKPSVARDIARVLGANKRGQGYLQGNGYVVTWAIGHLVSLAQPHEIRPEWQKWRLDLLPMLPESWPLVVYPNSKDQFDVVSRILSSPRVARVVCATDAGREGELIFRYIYEAAHCDKPVERLWISSMTEEAIRKGFDTLRPGVEYDQLADAANGRSRADWLVGMNLSRAYSLLYREDLSVGRVQTPTLAMVVERELALRNFVAEEYIEIIARFSADGKQTAYDGTWFTEEREQGTDKIVRQSRLPADGAVANEILERAKSGQAAIASIQLETQRTQPPLLYDLTELQRHANRLYGFSAQETLNLAQALYEKHKLISYPRTDSRHLSADVAETLGRIARVVAPQYANMVAAGTGERIPGKRYVDDSKVTDHHAILPNAVAPGMLGDGERKIYDLVCRRFLSMWHEDQLQAVTTVITTISKDAFVDHYLTKGTLVQQEGWKVLDLKTEKRKKGDEEGEQVLPTTLAEGQEQKVDKVEARKKKTKAPKRFTEGTLLTAMQTAGQNLDEKELSEAMKETGLGTPATRASIIEVLLKRGYIVRSGKMLEATEKGIHLIEVVHPEVKSPAMTGQWESFLKKIQHGDAQLDPFIEGIHEYIRAVVGKVRITPRSAAPRPVAPAPSEAKAALKPAELNKLIAARLQHEKLYPKQKSAYQSLANGLDAVVALPDGEGKTTTALLATWALDVTTLLIDHDITALLALAERLRGLGCTVTCLHAEMERDQLRTACMEYLSGKVQFFLVAAERFGVEGFTAMLTKRKPGLVVIENAQCVTEKSGDSSAEYTHLAKQLQMLRPARMLALTAKNSSRTLAQIAEMFAMQTKTTGE